VASTQSSFTREINMPTPITAPHPIQQYFALAATPSQVAERLGQPSSDMIVVPQELELDIESLVKCAEVADQRRLIGSREADDALTSVLTDMRIDEPGLRRHMGQAIDFFSETFECDRLEVRIEIADRQSCPKFHFDNVYVRMIVTYCGPATELIELNQPETVLQPPLHSLLFLKGPRHPNFQRRVLHRSPTFLPGQRRLCMIVNLPNWRPAL
jgi:hypothetical protein